MAKKLITPEEYKSKMDKKVEKRKRFGKAFLTTFAYALACVIVFASMAIAFTPKSTVSVAAGGTGNGNAVQSNSNDVDSNGDGAGEDVTSGGDEAEAPGDDKANNGKEENKGGASEVKNDATQQAIDLYKKAIVKARSSAKTVTHTKTGATNYKNIVEAGALSSAASTLMGLFMKESEPNEAIDKSELPPKGGANKLTKANVKSATVKEEGGSHVVTINFKNAVNPTNGSDGIGSAVNVIEESQITGSISSVPGLKLSNIKVAYENVYITCKIDKASGNMTYLFVDAPCILSLDAKLGFISVDGAKVGIECKDEYTIAY